MKTQVVVSMLHQMAICVRNTCMTPLLRCIALLGGLAMLSLAAHAQETSLSMVSDPGDYIGQGQTYYYSSTDGSFTAQKNYDQGVSISFHTPAYEHWWYLDFAGPSSQPLTVGTYTGALRFPFQGTAPGLSVAGDGRGCNTLTGTFQVLQVVYGSSSDITAFDATFEQHCEGFSQALRGEIRYNADVVVVLTAPTSRTAIQDQNLTFTVTATDAQSRHVVLSASGLPPGATFVDNGNNTGTFSWTPTSSQLGSYSVAFQGDNQQGNVGGITTQIQVIAPPPPNDDFAQATPVPAIPFTTSENVTNATVATDDPVTCFNRNQTVWYAFTPHTDMRLEANTFGSNYDTTLAVFTGTRGALTQIGCNDDANGTLNSRVRFDATAGTTYYVMVSSLYPVSSANLMFNLQEAPPALSFAPTVSQFQSVTPSTGAVTIAGSVMCNKPAYVSITGQVKQVHAGVPINGYYSTFVPCNGTKAWSAPVQTQTTLFQGRSAALFTGGKATVTGNAYAVDPDTGEFKQKNFVVDVILRGTK